jgi:hypothetical protein
MNVAGCLELMVLAWILQQFIGGKEKPAGDVADGLVTS